MPSNAASKSTERTKIPWSNILVPPGRGRKDFGHVGDLAESIKTTGLVHPPTFNKVGDQYRLIAGECRLRALQLLRLQDPTHPAVSGGCDGTLFEGLDELEEKVAELVENTQREDVTWQERAETLRQIHELKETIARRDGGKWTLSDTAELKGLSPGIVSQQITLAKQLNERPDLAEKVAKLPWTVAKKVIEQTLDQERLTRLTKSGLAKQDHHLRHQDALTFLRSLANDSVGLILTDPPYGVEAIENAQGSAGGTGNTNYTAVMQHDDNMSKESVLGLLKEVSKEMTRVLAPGRHFYLFCDSELVSIIGMLLISNGLTVRWPALIWNKNEGMAAFLGYNYIPCYETIIYGYKGPAPRRLAKYMRCIIDCKPLDQKIHPFEKPQELLKTLIEQSTGEGDLVVDPFAGSGSTILAARSMGRAALGCEKDINRFQKAQERLTKGQ